MAVRINRFSAVAASALWCALLPASGLTNQTGAIVAEGAAKANGVGIFRTGPKCCIPPGAIGPHEYIVGAQ